MRIFLFCGSDYGVGTFVRAREFARAFHRMGHFVVLGYLGKKLLGMERRQDQGFLEIGFPRFLNRMNLDHLAGPATVYMAMKLVREMKFDVVHGFEHYAAIHHAAKHAGKINGALYVTDWADWISASSKRKFYVLPGGREYLRWLERRAKISADGVTAISHPLRDEVVRLGQPAEKVILLPGGAPVRRLRPLDMWKCREEIGIPAGGVLFGYMGSWLTEELIPFVEAFAQLAQKPKPKMLIMGNCSRELSDYVANNGLSERVLIKGFIEETILNQYLCACNALLIPMMDNQYNRSRWPNKIGDYMACGRPVIASGVGEVPSVFEMGKMGYMVDKNIDSIRGAMTKIADNDDNIQVSLGMTARKIAEENISWDALSCKLMTFYESLMNRC